MNVYYYDKTHKLWYGTVDGCNAVMRIGDAGPTTTGEGCIPHPESPIVSADSAPAAVGCMRPYQVTQFFPHHFINGAFRRIDDNRLETDVLVRKCGQAITGLLAMPWRGGKTEICLTNMLSGTKTCVAAFRELGGCFNVVFDFFHYPEGSERRSHGVQRLIFDNLEWAQQELAVMNAAFRKWGYA